MPLTVKCQQRQGSAGEGLRFDSVTGFQLEDIIRKSSRVTLAHGWGLMPAEQGMDSPAGAAAPVRPRLAGPGDTLHSPGDPGPLGVRGRLCYRGRSSQVPPRRCRFEAPSSAGWLGRRGQPPRGGRSQTAPRRRRRWPGRSRPRRARPAGGRASPGRLRPLRGKVEEASIVRVVQAHEEHVPVSLDGDANLISHGPWPFLMRIPGGRRTGARSCCAGAVGRSGWVRWWRGWLAG